MSDLAAGRLLALPRENGSVCAEGAARLVRAALSLAVADAKAGSAEAIEWLKTGRGREWCELLWGARGGERLDALLSECEPREDFDGRRVRLPQPLGRRLARRG